MDDHFFPQLRAMIATIRAHDMAYVDMAKWENLLIGHDGHPCLLDYQIHFHLPHPWPLRWVLRYVQSADLFYLHRQWMRARPDQASPTDRTAWMREPGLVRIGEILGVPWRWVRLRILALFRVKIDPRRAIRLEVGRARSG